MKKNAVGSCSVAACPPQRLLSVWEEKEEAQISNAHSDVSWWGKVDQDTQQKGEKTEVSQLQLQKGLNAVNVNKTECNDLQIFQSIQHRKHIKRLNWENK